MIKLNLNFNFDDVLNSRYNIFIGYNYFQNLTDKMKFLTLFVAMTSLSVSDTSKLMSIMRWRGENATSTNEVRASEDSYSVYKAMMMNVFGSNEQSEDTEAENVPVTTTQPPDSLEKSTEMSTPKVIQTVQEAFSVLFEVTVLGLYEGLVPHVERQRREASEEKRTYIDLVINFIGALLGRQQCSQILACRYAETILTMAST